MNRYTVIGIYLDGGDLYIAGVAEGEVNMVDTEPDRFANFYDAESPQDAERMALEESSGE